MTAHTQLVDKSYKNLATEALLDAPVSALSGVSAQDALLLKQAFGIDTIRELATNRYFMAARQLLGDQSEAASTKYYSVLQQQTEAAVRGVISDKVYSLQFPAQGGFLYNWQNLNNVFNEGTYSLISANVVPGNIPGAAALGPAGSFPNAYTQVLSGIEYSLNSTDTALLNKVQSDASAQQATIVQDFQNMFGTITDTNLAEARAVVGAWGARTKYDYIIAYVIGSQWSGTAADNKPPLSYAQMRSARDLKALLPARPASADRVINDVSIYLNMTQTVTTLQTQMQDGSWTVAQALANTRAPSGNNGGMQTFDPNDGAISGYRGAWKINKAIADIKNDLNNRERVIEFKLTTMAASGSALEVSVNGSTAFSVGSWLKFSLGADFSYDMSTFQGTSRDAEVTVRYEGYSIVPISPQAWQQDIDTGWYNDSVIRQAVENQGKDVTGFKFSSQTPPPFNFASLNDGGNFGWINNLIVSNYPTIIIKYKNADFKSFQQAWKANLSGNLKMFGFVSLGSFSAGASGSSYEQGSSNNEFTLIFSPSEQIISVPQDQQQAFVVATAVTNPGGVGQAG